MQRIGVFVCWCGTNIAATVDVNAVAEALGTRARRRLRHQTTSTCAPRPARIPDPGRHQGASASRGVVICSCSPRMHEATFRKTVAAKAGLNPYMLEIANIREQCSWIHKDKADGHGKGHYPGPRRHRQGPAQRPADPRRPAPSPSAPWSSAAASRASRPPWTSPTPAFPVDIVEKQPTIGGKMTQIDKTFPTLDCAACILTPKMVDGRAEREDPHLRLFSEVEAVKGFVGSFHRHHHAARPATSTRSRLHRLRPVHREVSSMKKVPNEFNLGLDNAPRHLHPLCPGRAQGRHHRPRPLHHAQERQVRPLRQGLLRPAPSTTSRRTRSSSAEYGAHCRGHRLQLPSSSTDYDEYAYAQSPDVVTSLEFERLTNAAGPTAGTLLRPSDGEASRTRIVFVQCVGSRGSNEGTAASPTAPRSAACTRPSTPC